MLQICTLNIPFVHIAAWFYNVNLTHWSIIIINDKCAKHAAHRRDVGLAYKTIQTSYVPSFVTQLKLTKQVANVPVLPASQG